MMSYFNIVEYTAAFLQEMDKVVVIGKRKGRVALMLDNNCTVIWVRDAERIRGSHEIIRSYGRLIGGIECS